MFENSDKFATVTFMIFLIGAFVGFVVGVLIVPSNDEGAITMQEYYNRQIMDERIDCYRHEYRNGRTPFICDGIMPMGDMPDQL